MRNLWRAAWGSMVAFAAAACGAGTTEETVYAAPDGAATGDLVFAPGEFGEAAAFAGVLDKLADKGWRVLVEERSGDALMRALAARRNEERCVVLAGFGDAAAPAIDAAVAHRKAGIDGIVTIAGLMREDVDYKHERIAGATISAEFDPIVTPLMIQGQAIEFPPLSEFLTIRGGNRAGFVTTVDAVEGDGESTLEPGQQELITANLIHNLLTKWCSSFNEPAVTPLRPDDNDAASTDGRGRDAGDDESDAD
ncbi:MAG: alpha/beta hydrolase [Pseudomonadota bacterium]